MLERLKNPFFSITLWPSHYHWWTPEQCVCLRLLLAHTCMWTYILLQKRVDLCRLFNIAENTTALSHLGKQVIAISIIYSNIQWSRPQMILTSRLTEINGAAHKQAYPPPPLPIPLSRLHLCRFSSLFPIIAVFFSTLWIIYFFFVLFISHFLFLSFFCLLSISFLFQSRTWTNIFTCSCDFSLTLKAVQSWITLSMYHKHKFKKKTKMTNN